MPPVQQPEIRGLALGRPRPGGRQREVSWRIIARYCKFDAHHIQPPGRIWCRLYRNHESFGFIHMLYCTLYSYSIITVSVIVIIITIITRYHQA